MLTFIIQFKYDSSDRLKNLIRGVIHLNNNFKDISEILIIDQDNNKDYLIDIFKSYNVHNVEVKSFQLEGPYHRSKIINEGIKISKYDLCFIYDCDILIPKHQTETALLLLSKYDVVFPYTSPQYDIPQNFFTDFLLEYNFNDIKEKISPRQYGITDDRLMLNHGNAAFGMLINKKTLGNLAYFNEDFNGWGFEDGEYLYRLDKFGAKISRVWGPIFHVEHERFLQFQYNHYTESNNKLYQNIKKMGMDELINYYKNKKLIN